MASSHACALVQGGLPNPQCGKVLLCGSSSLQTPSRNFSRSNQASETLKYLISSWMNLNTQTYKNMLRMLRIASDCHWIQSFGKLRRKPPSRGGHCNTPYPCCIEKWRNPKVSNWLYLGLPSGKVVVSLLKATMFFSTPHLQKLESLTHPKPLVLLSLPKHYVQLCSTAVVLLVSSRLTFL